MTDQICVAIDGMGGDKAPHMIIGGVNRVAHTHQNVKFLIFGDEAKLGPLLEEFPSIQATS